MKILLYGVFSENNFGGPSLIHGAEEIIYTLHKNPEIIIYQQSKPEKIAVSDFKSKVYPIPYDKPLIMFIDAIKYKIGLNPKQKQRQRFFEHIKTSDIVANLSGICFCSNFYNRKFSYFKTIKSTINQFSLSVIAKLYNTNTVKCPASYGPMLTNHDRRAAKIAAGLIFETIIARENESKQQMISLAGVNRQIEVAPDLANFMCYDKPKTDEPICIGVSISHQVIRQWKSSESYIDCITNLLKEINTNTNHKVLLIPNEISHGKRYDDFHVANEILELLDYPEEIQILDIIPLNSSQIKNTIASCELMVASRYHSSVAALSSGVPTLIIGWHYKYDELLQLYGQDKWILSNNDCTSEKLINLFNALWIDREKEKEIIHSKFHEVQNALINAGNIMFTH